VAFPKQSLGGWGYTRRLDRLTAIEAERGLRADPILRLATLGLAIPEDAERLRDRLRLANADFERLRATAEALIGLHGSVTPPSCHGLRKLLFSVGREAARDALMLAQAESEAPPSDEAFAAADRFLADAPEPKLPISGADLIARGVAAGWQVGRALRAFQALWIRAGFPNESETLASLLDAAIAESGHAQVSETGADRGGSGASDPPRHQPNRPDEPKIQTEAQSPFKSTQIKPHFNK
jgi:poly(A) polymerase